jgi:Transposase IS116/IS110/IS902 family
MGGMTPTVRTSDIRTGLGHISHQGSPALRWALVEAAQHAARSGGPLRQAFERIAKRRGPPGRQGRRRPQILTLCFYGLRDGEFRCLAPRAKAARSERGGHLVTSRGAHVLHTPPASGNSGELSIGAEKRTAFRNRKVLHSVGGWAAQAESRSDGAWAAGTTSGPRSRRR